MSVEFRPARPRAKNERIIFFDGEVVDGRRMQFYIDSLPLDTNIDIFKPFDRFGLRGRYVIAPEIVEVNANSIMLATEVKGKRRTIALVKDAFPKEGFPIVLFDAQHDNPQEGMLIPRPSTKRPAGKSSSD